MMRYAIIFLTLGALVSLKLAAPQKKKRGIRKFGKISKKSRSTVFGFIMTCFRRFKKPTTLASLYWSCSAAFPERNLTRAGL